MAQQLGGPPQASQPCRASRVKWRCGASPWHSWRSIRPAWRAAAHSPPHAAHRRAHPWETPAQHATPLAGQQSQDQPATHHGLDPSWGPKTNVAKAPPPYVVRVARLVAGGGLTCLFPERRRATSASASASSARTPRTSLARTSRCTDKSHAWGTGGQAREERGQGRRATG